MTNLIPQAAAIPFRRSGDRLEICLITSLTRKRWIFPKGIIDPGETVAETALKEAFEEAGLHGRIVGDPMGTYTYSKWGTTLEVTVVLMEVERADASWEEAELRQRRWVSPDEALELVSQAELVHLLRKALLVLERSDP